MLATLVMCPSILDQRIRMYSAVFASHSGGGRTLNTERVCLFTIKKKEISAVTTKQSRDLWPFSVFLSSAKFQITMHSFECNNLQMAVFELPTTTAVISVSPHWKRVARNSSDYFGFSYRQWRGGCAAAGKKVSDSDYRASPDTCLHTYTLVPQHTYTDTLILTTWQACPQSRPGNAGQRITLLLCVSSAPLLHLQNRGGGWRRVCYNPFLECC